MHPDDHIDPEDAARLHDLVHGDEDRELVAAYRIRIVDRTEIPDGADLTMVPGDGPEFTLLFARDAAARLVAQELGTDIDPDDVERLATDQLALMLMEAFEDPGLGATG